MYVTKIVFSLSILLVTSSSIAQSTDSLDSTRNYSLPYWKAKKLYQLASRATIADTVIRNQREELELYSVLQIAQDSSMVNKDKEIKTCMALYKEADARTETQIKITQAYKREANFWKWFGIVCLGFGGFIAVK